MRIAIPWMNTPSPRLDRQQSMLCRRLLSEGHNLFIVAPEPRPLLCDVLCAVRKAAGNAQYFGYANSDCYPFLRLNDVARPGGVVGLTRVESNGICYHGVDLFIFDTQVWDKHYAPDLPKMYVGSHATDWWIARTAHKFGLYTEIPGLRHETHPRSAASAGKDAATKSGTAEWEAYAKRKGLNPGVIPNLKKNSVE